MKKKKIVDTYRPSTHAIYLCLKTYPHWSRLALGHGKDYDSFLAKVIDANFFTNQEEKMTIKTLAESLGYKRELITKWLGQIYQDIFELNFDHPELFKGDGIKHELYLKSNHGSAALTVWLRSTPRLYERLDIYFVKAKLGIDFFWVKDVQHSIDDSEHTVSIWLQDGFCNKYRELLVERAQYFGFLGFMDVYEKMDFEIDRELKKIYKY